MATIHNVHDRRNGWIGSWEASKMDILDLVDSNIGKTVIYVDATDRREAGTLSSFRGDTVWARFSTGSTAASCRLEDLWLAVKPLDGDLTR